MELILGIILGAIVLGIVLFTLWEYRIRQPDVLVLSEADGHISIRKSPLYPRHFSLPLKRLTSPFQLTIDANTAGYLGVRVKLSGSVAPSATHIQALVRVGGWDLEAVSRAAEEAQTLLETLVKEYTEKFEIQALSSTGVQAHLNEQFALIEEQYGVELISLVVQSLEPIDVRIAEALQQQNQARLLEETEKLSHQARVSAAKVKYQVDEEIAEMEHTLELKKIELQKVRLEKESALAEQRLQDELRRDRLHLAFEKEELEVFLNSPELLMLTPQAARLAEASQSLKNARTVISLTPQELDHGSELLGFFQNLLRKAVEAKKESPS